MSERTALMRSEERSRISVKKICICAVCAVTVVIIITIVVAVLYFLAQVGATKEEEKETGPLTCFSCEERKNVNKASFVPWGNNRRKRNVAYYMDDSGNDKAFEECLKNPREDQAQLCAEGQFCMVLQQRLNEVERITRGCYQGGKYGCNNKIVYGIDEKVCLCDKSLCLIKPFVDQQ